MNKQEQWREEFANWWIDSFCPEEDKIKSGDYLKKCILKDELCDVEMSAYLAGRKKGDEEVEKWKRCNDLNVETCKEMEKEIAQLKKENGFILAKNWQAIIPELIQLKEELKRESEENQINVKLIAELAEVRIYNSANVFKGAMIRDNSKVHDLVKRARSVQAHRGNL